MFKGKAENKRIINNIDVHLGVQPLKYKWAWECYLKGVNNNWLPTEVSMAKDIETWKSNKLTQDERLLIMRSLGFFSTAEILVGNNLSMSVFKYITNPEIRVALGRQIFEEMIHTHTFIYIVDSLNLNEGEIWQMYRQIPSIANKDKFQIENLKEITEGNLVLDSTQNIQKFVKNLVAYYIIMEGIFFYSGFAAILSLGRRNLLTGVSEQYQYILRDESMHLELGRNIINGIIEENPTIWTSEFKEELIELIKEAVNLEIEFARDFLPRGILGVNPKDLEDYIKHIADRRLESINLPILYKTKNSFGWLSEVIDLRKEKNFFESKVTEYQNSGSLIW